MEYLALYRKYRPMNFEEMVGQGEIKSILTSSIQNNTISHAYLFSGPRGTGKTSSAKIFAKLVNCEHLKDGVPCGECASCISISNNNDVVEIDAASNNGVDEIRELREKANLVPSVCKYKVYIIDEVHMLTTQAFNALLKTLEEPPKHVIFILATTEYHKVPLTITSRCQKFQFNKLSIDDNFSRLKDIAVNENIDITDDALYEIAKISDGGMRDSINFLDQMRSYKQDNITLDDVYYVCGSISIEEIINLLVDMHNNNSQGIVSILEEIGNKGKNYGKFLEEFLSILKDIILLKNNVSSSNIRTDVNKLSNVLGMYSLSDIYYIIDNINSLLEKLKYVSKQSVVVVTNFLLMMSKINNIYTDSYGNDDKKMVKVQDEQIYEPAFSIQTKNDELTVNLSKNDDKVEDNKTVDRYKINRDIIVNNAFATADKNIKSSLHEKWLKISDFLLDKRFSQIASKICDSTLEVGSSDYLIFMNSYDSIVDFVYKNYNLCDELVEKILGKKYYFAFLNGEEWDNKKNEFISAHKSGIKYHVKELIIEESSDETNLEKTESNSVVDKLFSLVGEDSVEFK